MSDEVNKYFENLDLEKRTQIEKIRQLILSHPANFSEEIDYKLPAYKKDGEHLFSLASQKHYISFYACYYDLLKKLSVDLNKYNCGNSCIRLKNVDDQALHDISKVIDYILLNEKKSKYHGKSDI